MNESKSNFSLYTYQCGSLKIFEHRSKRAKYDTFDQAIEAARKYLARLKKVFGEDYQHPQALIVEYDDRWESKIVGIITNDNIHIIPWQQTL